MSTDGARRALTTFFSEISKHLESAAPHPPIPSPTEATPSPVVEQSSWSKQMSFLDAAYKEYAHIPERQKQMMIKRGFQEQFNVDEPTMKKIFGKGKRSSPETRSEAAATTTSEPVTPVAEPPKEPDAKKPRTTTSSSSLLPTPDDFKKSLSQVVGSGQSTETTSSE